MKSVVLPPPNLATLIPTQPHTHRPTQERQRQQRADDHQGRKTMSVATLNALLEKATDPDKVCSREGKGQGKWRWTCMCMGMGTGILVKRA